MGRAVVEAVYNHSVCARWVSESNPDGNDHALLPIFRILHCLSQQGEALMVNLDLQVKNELLNDAIKS